jgi:hypothetical protein
MSPLRVVLALALSLSAAGASCPSAPGKASGELTVHHAKWNARGLRHYRYEFQRSCECLPEMAPPVVIEVRDGIVVAVAHVQTGESLGSTSAANRPTVDELFNELQRAFRDADRVDVTYDPTFDYPSRVTIDWDVNVADEERIYVAKNLTPLP